MSETPARDAVYGELMWPEWNPTSESHGTSQEQANNLLDAHAAEVRAMVLRDFLDRLENAAGESAVEMLLAHNPDLTPAAVSGPGSSR